MEVDKVSSDSIDALYAAGRPDYRQASKTQLSADEIDQYYQQLKQDSSRDQSGMDEPTGKRDQ